jgi:hypothetical protein
MRHAPPPPPLAKGAIALMVLLCALLGVALTSATPRLPTVRAAHALTHVTPSRAWTALRPIAAPTRSVAALNASIQRWLPNSGAQIDAVAFMSEFGARWPSILASAPPGSGRALRDFIDRLYRQAGRYPTLIATWTLAHDHCQRMRSPALSAALGPAASLTLRALTASCAEVSPWLAYGVSELGDPVAALSLIREVARQQPDNTEALFFYALIILQQPSQDPAALLTFRNLIHEVLRREPAFTLLDITADQLRAERSEADNLLRNIPPATPPRRVAADALHLALADAWAHAQLYITPLQRLAAWGHTSAWWLTRTTSPAITALRALARPSTPPADAPPADAPSTTPGDSPK